MHSITITDSKGNMVYTSGFINNTTASKPFTFNNAGSFSYSGPIYDKMWPNYKMNGTLTVVNQPLVTTFKNTAGTAASTNQQSTWSPKSNNPDTIATFVVQANIANKTISDLKKRFYN